MKKILEKDNFFIRLIVIFVALSLIFVAGIFSTDVKIEDTSQYASYVVKNNTPNKTVISLVVSKKNENSEQLPSWETEFYSLYGSFKERTITFASTINADKHYDLKLNDGCNNISSSVSMLYFGPLGTIQYPANNPTNYKHYILPIELMFEDSKKSYDVNRYIINISQSHANKLLLNKGYTPQNDGNFLLEEYEQLIRTECTLIKNGTDISKVCINNIYLEKNYYFEGLKETLKDFVMVSYYLPWNLRNEQENCYFLNDSEYQNSYFMRYINNVYGKEKYIIRLNHNNIIGDVDDKRIVNFNSNINSSLNWLSVFILTLSILLLAFSILIMVKFSVLIKKEIVLEAIILIIPYLLFYILYKIINNLLIFSSFSCKCYLFMTLGYLFIVLFITFLRVRRKKQLDKFGEKFYVQNI